MVIPPPVRVNGRMMSHTLVLVFQSSRPPTIWYAAAMFVLMTSDIWSAPRREVALSAIVMAACFSFEAT
ncbi:hypothetical protein D3C83_287430 [compost metagenome]